MGIRTTKSNVPQAVALRWNVEKAGVEFGLTATTLRKALNKNSAAADKDALYSTRQIAAAIYGSMHVEKLATQRQLTRRYELDNAIVDASVLNRGELEAVFAQIADSLHQVVMASELPRKSKEDFLHNLSTWHVAVDNVARNQTRLPRGNGQRDEDES